MNYLLGYLIACGIGAIICISITIGCFKLLEKWDKESKGMLE